MEPVHENLLEHWIPLHRKQCMKGRQFILSHLCRYVVSFLIGPAWKPINLIVKRKIKSNSYQHVR